MEESESLSHLSIELRPHLAGLMDALPDGVLLVDVDGRIVLANARMEELSGFDRHDLIGKLVENLIPERLRVQHEHNRHQFQARPQLRPMGAALDTRLHRKDGSDLPVDIQLSPIEIDGAKFSVAAIRDVTERKKVEDALSESEERFRTLVESAPVMVSALSSDGKLTFLNKAFETITGFRREDWLGRHFSDIVDARDVTGGSDRIHQVIEGEPVEAREARVRTASGEYRLVESVAVPLVGRGKVVGTLGISQDVTEVRLAEQALRQSEERFRKIFEDGPVGILLVDGNDRIFDVNKAMCRVIGYPKDELLGESIFTFVHPEDRDDARTRRQEVVEGRVPSHHVERHWNTKAGGVAITNLTVSMIRDVDGSPVCGLLIVHDITERRALEEQLASHAALANETLSTLTPRERETLTLLRDGLTAPEIAEQLVVSVRTVESHIASSYRKLGVRSREEAMARFDRLLAAASASPFRTTPD